MRAFPRGCLLPQPFRVHNRIGYDIITSLTNFRNPDASALRLCGAKWAVATDDRANGQRLHQRRGSETVVTFVLS